MLKMYSTSFREFSLDLFLNTAQLCSEENFPVFSSTTINSKTVFGVSWSFPESFLHGYSDMISAGGGLKFGELAGSSQRDGKGAKNEKPQASRGREWGGDVPVQAD